MYVLGIETSCDETSAAVVKDGRQILSCAVISSLKFHKKYRGIIPEIASRMQLEAIDAVMDSALLTAGIKRKDIGLIAVTDQPGLPGSLLVGVCFSRAASFGLGVPFLKLNHLQSHIYAAFLEQEAIIFPFVALIVSGGHTSLFFVTGFGQVELLGSTQDDACGEAFDKVAKVLGLGYPGGPGIEKLAQKGDAKKFRFSCSNTRNIFDFSFSGIKTAVLYASKGYTGKLSLTLKRDLAASFQEAVIEALIFKSIAACRIKKVKRLVVGGGVAANSYLREKLLQEARLRNIRVYFPEKKFCLDNAAMVAGLGYQLFRKEVLHGG